MDLAIKEQRVGASGAKGKTGTRAFMAIGALMGEQHSFMHDLESFFWVLFWICVHYNGLGKSKVVAKFDEWNYADTEELAKLKKGRYLMSEILSAKRRRTLRRITSRWYLGSTGYGKLCFQTVRGGRGRTVGCMLR